MDDVTNTENRSNRDAASFAANVDGTKRAHGDWDGGNTTEGIDAQNEWLEKVAAEKRAAATRSDVLAQLVAEVYETPAALWALGLDWMARAGAALSRADLPPLPTDGPDYHADLAFWKERNRAE